MLSKLNKTLDILLPRRKCTLVSLDTFVSAACLLNKQSFLNFIFYAIIEHFCKYIIFMH